MGFQISRRFLLAGNAVFTVRSHRSGRHFTFRVSQAKDGGMYFVSVMTSYQEFTYCGVLVPKTGELKLTKASTCRDDSPCVRAFRWVSSALWKGEYPRQCDVMHEGSCCRCGRPLDDPESIDLGIGPTCREKGEW